MKLKSLILGSAAALVASGAYAADAAMEILPEAEPVEYVRVCDTFGAGFYYIPGGETCLRISGFVWYQINASDGTDSFTHKTRARLNIDARSDTEWGVLRSYIRLQADWNAQNQNQNVNLSDDVLALINSGSDIPITNPGASFGYKTDGIAKVDKAFIELGGLRMGYVDSAWAQTQYGGASNWGSHSYGGMAYGHNERQLIAYSFRGTSGFFGTVSLEDDGSDNYIPDVVGKIGMVQEWGAVWLKGAYDEDIGGDESGVALSGGLHFNIPNTAGDSLRVIGFYADQNNAYDSGSEWSAMVSYLHRFTDTFSASAALQYFNDTTWDDGPDAWQGELSVVWTPVQNFRIRGEVTYKKVDNADATTKGFLRFRRSF